MAAVILDTPDGGWDEYEAPSCAGHATPAERVEHANMRALEEEQGRKLRLAETAECWSWPVTEQDRRRAAEVAACSDTEEADHLGHRLLYDWHAGRCAVCGDTRSRLEDDHDHDTGMMRGMLCRSCNLSEGFAGAGTVFELYRIKNPASILGLAVRYYHVIYGRAEPAPIVDEAERFAGHAAYILATRYGVRPEDGL